MDETQELASTEPAILVDAPTLSVTQTGHTVALEPGQKRAPSEPSEVPEQVGRYRVEHLLGEGGMGMVYRARDHELDRRVAVKLLRPELMRGHSLGSARERMRREARAMARLEHPNVVRVYEVGETAGQLFVAMEFVEGQTLGEWIEAESRSWAEIAAVFVQAGEGLLAAHDVGIVHRDFKPHNVLVELDRGASQLVGVRARVLDFGLAGIGESLSELDALESGAGGEPESLSETALRLTKTGTLLGTPAYMAPEQFIGAQVDARADQFAFCIAFYEALFGRRPFAGDTLESLRQAVLAGELRKPPIDSDVPAWLVRLVMRGLETDADARWPDMRELLVELTSRLGTAVADEASRSVGRKTRTRLFAAFGLGILLFAVPAFGTLNLDPERALRVIAVVGPLATLATLAVVFLFREQLLSTRYNRRASALIVGIMLATMGNVIHAVLAGHGVIVADRANLMVLVAATLLASASVERNLLVVTALSTVAFGLSFWLPVVGGVGFGLSMVLLCGFIALGDNQRHRVGAGISLSLRGSSLRRPESELGT